MANREKQDMTAELAEGKILPLVFKLTIPAVIAQLITFLYNIVDRMYVARIEGSGMDALAALGIVLPITLIMQAFANLVGLGGAPRAGIKLGEGKADEANRIFHTAFCLLVLLGVVIGAAAFCFARQIVLLFGCPESAVEFAVSYLKIYACGTIFVMLAQGLNPFILTQGYSWLAMSSVLLGALINIALDPLFIFTFKMGVQGSSLATILSQLCSCIWIVLLFLLPEEPVPLSGKPAGPVAGAHFQHSFAGLYAVHHDADGMRHPDRLQHQSEPRDRRQQGLYRRVDRHAERAAAYFPAPERSWKRYAAVREL